MFTVPMSQLNENKRAIAYSSYVESKKQQKQRKQKT